ncbi:hypothetical protein Q1695_000069 [Nippostrongylus brasiliensis]|nr:hypothetical protein Q1695_000069 [Nippostrongylus brasiliensis]
MNFPTYSHYHILIFACILGLNEIRSEAGYTLTNPGYPIPYKGSLPKYFIAGEGQGVAVFFYQFLANAGDCVTVCDDQAVCLSLCGDAMDHVNMKKALVVNSSAMLTMLSISNSDGYYHSGIYLTVQLFDLQKRSYFDCNSTVELNDGNPFFLVSQNYPYTPFDFSECYVVFKSKDAIRVAIYDFVTKNPVIFEGSDLSGTHSRIELSGREVTDDEPVALYFLNMLTVSFAFRNLSTYYTRGFYILVDSYTNACVNDGDRVLEFGEGILVETEGFGGESYANNINCSYAFHRSAENHRIAIGMQYETEKCCDIMLIHGIAPPPYDLYNYQGYMQPLFQFANNSVVSMAFTSDGLVGGSGFSGYVYDIDCSCGPNIFLLSEEERSINISSPGLLSGAPTYCPDVSCSWSVEFSTDYEVLTNFLLLNLRVVSAQTDFLTVKDNFGRILLEENSNQYVPIPVMITTSGQLFFEFSSLPVTAFPPPTSPQGFLIDLTLVKKNFQRKTIIFTDDNFFADISTHSFVDGLNMTYEYSITARPNMQVTIYFFTTLDGMINLDVYDGIDSNSKKINTSYLYTTALKDGEPLQLSSSGRNILLRVRPNLYNVKAVLDFQAMVTDYRQDRSCPPLVLTSASMNTLLTVQLSGTTCMNVYHSTNNYDSSIGITVGLGAASSVTLYKGLSVNVSHIIKSPTSHEYPEFIYDSYVVLFYNNSQENVATYSWSQRGFVTTLTMKPNDTGIIMSEDYLPEYPLAPFEQQFSIELIADSTHMTGIRIEFLKSTGQGYGTLQMQQYNKVLDKITYPLQSGVNSVEECGTKMIISYISPGGSSNGLYVRYSRGSLNCNGSMSLQIPILLVLVLMVIYS